MSSAGAPRLRAELTRKAIHAATALLPLAWASGWLSTVQLRWLLLGASSVALVVESLRRRSDDVARRFDALVGPLLRPHERSALTGATWLAVTMAAAVWLAPATAALAALWAGAIGDASAAVVGRIAAHRRGQAPSGKTLIGSAAAALTTALGVWWLAGVGLATAGLLGLVAALAERPRWALDDNVRVITAVAIAATLLVPR